LGKRTVGIRNAKAGGMPKPEDSKEFELLARENPRKQGNPLLNEKAKETEVGPGKEGQPSLGRGERKGGSAVGSRKTPRKDTWGAKKG